MYYEAAIVTTHPKCSSYKTQRVAVFQEASTSSKMQQESGIRNEFFKDLCDAMVAADIPWYKLQVLEFR
jgi:hypothetical protein